MSATAAGETAVRLNRTAIAAARAAGAQPVLSTSRLGSSPDSAYAPRRTHAASEAALQELGRPFTSLRNGFYTSSAVMQLSRALGNGRAGRARGRADRLDSARRALPGPIGTTVTPWLPSNAGRFHAQSVYARHAQRLDRSDGPGRLGGGGTGRSRGAAAQQSRLRR